MNTPFKPKVILNSRMDKSILKQKRLNHIKDLINKATIDWNTKEIIRLNAEYEKLLTSSSIVDDIANGKTLVTASGQRNTIVPETKKETGDKNKNDFDFVDNPDNEEFNKAVGFNTRLINLINLKNQTK